MIPGFYLSLQIEKLINRKGAKIVTHGTLLYENGEPVELDSLYKDHFLNRLNRGHKELNEKMGSYTYEPLTMNINYKSKIICS